MFQDIDLEKQVNMKSRFVRQVPLQKLLYLASQTTYLSSWSDIITHAAGSNSSFQRCNGPFTTPTSFLNLFQICENTWTIGGLLTNAGTTSTTMSFEFRINALTNGSNDLDTLEVAVLTIDNVSPQNFSFNRQTLVDFASGAQGVSDINVQTKTNELEIYSSSCSQVDSH